MTEPDKDALIRELAEALERVLKAANQEAKASMSAKVAAANFSDDGPEIRAFERACIESSQAAKHALDLLSSIPVELRKP